MTVEIFLYLFAGVIGLVIFYYIIEGAVRSGTKELRTIQKKQNDILLMLLNRQGIGKDELQEIFLKEKKDLWSAMKNYQSE